MHPTVLSSPRSIAPALVCASLIALCLPRLSQADDTPSDESAPGDDTPTEEPDPAPEESETPANPDASDDDWIDIEVVPDFSSAVETGLEGDIEDDTVPPGLKALFSSEADRASRRPATRWGFRPVVGFQGASTADDVFARSGHAGIRIAHQWWSPTHAPIRPAGETRLQTSGLFGQVSGFDATLDSLGGSWLGPVGLFAGGQVRADRRKWSSTVDLPPAVGVGPSAQVALRVGNVTPWVGASPAWLVAGDRTGLADAPWDELTARGGFILNGNWAETRLSGTWRAVDGADLWDITVGFHFRIAPNQSSRRS